MFNGRLHARCQDLRARTNHNRGQGKCPPARPARWFALAVALMVSGPALAQVTADGGIVNLTAPQATCSASICFEAKNNGTINSNGNPVNVTIPDDPGGNNFGALAHLGGTINLVNGGNLTIGDLGTGLLAGEKDGSNPGTIVGTGLRFSSGAGAIANTYVWANGAGSTLTLNGTTTLGGTVTVALTTDNGGVITANGPVNGTLVDSTIADATGGGRVDFNGGGTVNVSGDFIYLYGAFETGTITTHGVVAHLTGGSALGGTFFLLENNGTIELTDTAVDGTNSGLLYGLQLKFTGAANATLDNSQLTLNSAGKAIFVAGNNGRSRSRTARRSPRSAMAPPTRWFS